MTHEAVANSSLPPGENAIEATGPTDLSDSILRVKAPGWAIIGIFILMMIAALAYGRNFLMPVVLAVLLQLVFSPIRRQLGKFGLPSAASAFIIVGLLMLTVVGSIYGLAAPVSSWLERAPLMGERLAEAVLELQGATEGVREAAEQVEEIANGEAEENDVQRVKVENSPAITMLVAKLPVVMAQVFFTLVLLFFLLSSGDMFYEKIVHAMPSFSDKRNAVRIAFHIERQLSRYLLSITLINAGLGVCIGLVMWMLGMPTPMLFGILACFLNFIPYVGALIGVCIASAVGLLTFEAWQDALFAGGIYFLLTVFEGQLVTPYIVGRSLRLNTVVVFISVSLFAWLWSVVGMLVATPLLVTMRTFCEYSPSLQRFGHFLSERGAELKDINNESNSDEATE